ncbi:anti-FecI sigma factor, FecR [Indibacter alkaliphilus LW1]|uniref:Anti-FecI sigma factor, FecR n=1 Tax=Indibacter alkaliphilus (strain CCUG 57479 / KCTC 22604 / LW1) TaxID=1189612 RepID=S2DIW0_INDAL|nr:FecR domain-containing protein [Indibacter alkaliphilus]EOZ97140.1 anti-FecI sigma factor, FecR [Indibacter alkaliphilus LW1]
MENHKISRLLDKYLNGTANELEKQLLENWLDGIAASGSEKPDVNLEKVSRAKKNAMAAIRPTRKVFQSIVLKVAAILLPFLILTILLWKTVGSSYQEVVESTRVGEFKELLLPDSSFVLLKPNSSLSYQKGFEKERKVTLSGSAFFDVKRNPDKVFSVTADDSKIEVLGTSFEVQTYSQFPEQRITVASGKVAVAYKGNSVATLEQSEQLKINKQNGTVVQSKTEYYQDLKLKRLVFDNADLKEVAHLLTSYYDVQISHPDGTGLGLSANLEAGLDLEVIMDVLGSILSKYGLKIKKTGSKNYEIQ